MGCIQNNIHPA